MEQVQQNKMGTMSMGKLIANMAAPAIVAMLIQALYNVVDSIFVAKISQQALLSVSLAYPLQMLVISVAVGTGVGLNSVISRRLGEGNATVAGHCATHGLLLAVFSGVVFAIVAMVATVPFFRAFTDDPVVFAGGCTYTQIALGFSVFLIVSISAEKCIQATGNMLMPMVQNLAGAITNIILDPILIFGLFGAPRMGIKGAAIATIIGQTVSMVIGLVVLFTHKHEFKVTFRGFRLSPRIIWEIYRVGIPSIIMQSVASIMLTGMNAILYPLSQLGVSVLGVYFKLQSFVFMPVFGLTQGAMPVMGYNFGSHKKHRLMHAYRITVTGAFCIMLVGTVVFWLVPDKLLQMFSSDEASFQQMVTVGVPALRLISLSFVGAAFGIVNSTVFQAVGHGIASLIVSVTRQLLVILPVAYLLGKLGGLHVVWYAFPIAEIVACVVSFLLLLRVYRREIATMMPLEGVKEVEA